VLGIILGPIAEDNFLKGKLIADTDVGAFAYFFTGPMNIIIILLCAASIGYSIYGEIKAYKKAKEKMA
jgi:putative tricarboxylic transport membrane protein